MEKLLLLTIYKTEICFRHIKKIWFVSNVDQELMIDRF